MFSAVSRQRLPLSGRIIQTSLGTTRFFPSIHLPYLLHMIPCSYRALFCRANLPSCTALYAISVRQTRGLPAGSLVPRIRFPSDSTSRWTPLPSAMSFPLPGRLGTCTLKKRAPPGAHKNGLADFQKSTRPFLRPPELPHLQTTGNRR